MEIGIIKLAFLCAIKLLLCIRKRDVTFQVNDFFISFLLVRKLRLFLLYYNSCLSMFTYFIMAHLASVSNEQIKKLVENKDVCVIKHLFVRFLLRILLLFSLAKTIFDSPTARQILLLSPE